MDFSSVSAALTPYVVAMLVVVSVTALVARFVPWFSKKPRTDRQKLAIDALALVVGVGIGLSGRVSPDGDVWMRVADGFIVAALAIKNRDVAVRAMRIAKGKGGAA